MVRNLMHLLKTIAVLLLLMAGSARLSVGADASAAVSPPVAGPAAVAPAAGEHHGVPQAAPDLTHVGPLPISNSMVATWIVAVLLIGFARFATRRVQAVPSGAQNFWEWLVEILYNFLEGIIGPELVKKTFWFFATIFIFILFSNWFGLIPGVGTIGDGVQGPHGFHVIDPYLRGANADLNMTFAMALIFFALWIVWALQSNGVKGFFLHLFGPKGDTTGVLRLLMIAIFFLVGFLEILSILFRPISLSFRLYGNIFAGENMLETMANMVQHPAWAATLSRMLLPVPFYFMELLVGIVQAMVFMLLTAVFTLLICMHDEEHEKTAH